MWIPALQVVNSKTSKHAAVEFGQVSFFPSLLLLMRMLLIYPTFYPRILTLELLSGMKPAGGYSRLDLCYVNVFKQGLLIGIYLI
jgi:hypothetical protein